MKKKVVTISLFNLLFCVAPMLFGQNQAKELGYQYYTIDHENDTVDILVKSKKGQEMHQKGVLFLIQGSTARPLLITTKDGGHLSPFFFDEKLVLDDFHLVMVNKPGLPLITASEKLNKKGKYLDPVTGKLPKTYVENNNLEYYVKRNKAVVDFLASKPWVDTSSFVVGGHSEGSSIAVKLAAENEHITHVIYSGGNPYFSRILTMIAQDRKNETEEASWVEEDFAYWKNVVNDSLDISTSHGYNSYKGTYSFSKNENNIIRKLTIPVLITYGTKDESSPYVDMFRVECILQQTKNITFRSYLNFCLLYTSPSPRDA